MDPSNLQHHFMPLDVINARDPLTAWHENFKLDVTTLRQLLKLRTRTGDTAIREAMKPNLCEISTTVAQLEEALDAVSTYVDAEREEAVRLQAMRDRIFMQKRRVELIRDNLPETAMAELGLDALALVYDKENSCAGAGGRDYDGDIDGGFNVAVQNSKPMHSAPSTTAPSARKNSFSSKTSATKPAPTPTSSGGAGAGKKLGMATKGPSPGGPNGTGHGAGNSSFSNGVSSKPGGAGSKTRPKSRSKPVGARKPNSDIPPSSGENSKYDDGVGDGEVQVRSLTGEELAAVPQYLRGRLTVEKVDAVAKRMTTVARTKYGLLQRPITKLSTVERGQVDDFRQAESDETDGLVFLTDGEMKGFGSMRIDATVKAAIGVLRHVGSLKELRGKNRSRVFIIN